MRPKIDREALGGLERELFAGQSLKLAATVPAEPPAKVSFVAPSGAILEASDLVTVKEVLLNAFVDGVARSFCLRYLFKGSEMKKMDKLCINLDHLAQYYNVLLRLHSVLAPCRRMVCLMNAFLTVAHTVEGDTCDEQ